MTIVDDRATASLRALEIGAGALLTAEALAAIGVLAANPGRRLLAITAGFTSSPGGDVTSGRLVVSHLDVGVAAVVVCLLFAAGRLRALSARGFDRLTGSLRANRHGIRLIEYGFSSAIIVFVVARLNGVADVSALVPIYAITNGIILFAVAHERRPDDGQNIDRVGGWRSPLASAAALGIVPWGVIAFQQVGGILDGRSTPPLVTVITLLMLAAAFGHAVVQWREQSAFGRGADPFSGERASVILGAISISAFTWLIVVGVSLAKAT